MNRAASWIAALAPAFALGCSGGNASSTGSLAVGGDTSVGGAPNTGGTSSTRGSMTGGGTTSAGGLPSTGGTLVTGGANSAGGSSALGGAPSTGGIANTGGGMTSGGTTSAGGLPSTGGTLATGGARSTGGTTSAGGLSSTGGSKTSGGTTSAGGLPSTGGALATGGANSTGGSSPSGGATSTGGSKSTGGATSTASSSGPPMGWASWNSFAGTITYNIIKAQADAFVSSGLKAAGYQYVNIDEGWWQETRDSSGNITTIASDWPGGMQAIADYIHGLGLKAGIYTDAGKDGCGYYYPTGRPAAPGSGSEGHYDQDFLQFSKWGFDFVKVDWCGGNAEGLDSKTAYTAISTSIQKATAQTGRPMVLSVCNWGNQSPWNWAPSISTMWRTSGDIIYYGGTADMNRVLPNFDSAQHPTAQSPGHYNDPDMLIVGMTGFSLAQNRTHMALWAISGAPLLAGNKLDSMSADTKSVLTNSEVIAIDQDPLAQQGVKVADTGGLQVYSRVLSGTNRRAVLLLNRTTSAATITVRFADIGLGATATVRNVWTATDLGSKTTSYAVSVPSYDSVLLIVTGG
jgi:hypothetical protein